MDRVEKGFIDPLSARREASGVVRSTPSARLAAAGGILGALAASACCILPLVLFTLGISGAWIANLTRLAQRLLSGNDFSRYFGSECELLHTPYASF